MLSEVTINSTATSMFLDLLDVYQRNNIMIPRKDQQFIRKCLMEFVAIIGDHYGRKDQ